MKEIQGRTIKKHFLFAKKVSEIKGWLAVGLATAALVTTADNTAMSNEECNESEDETEDNTNDI